MLRYLSNKEKANSKELYKEAFYEDSNSFIEYYYKEKTKDNKILVYEKENQLASMAHLNPYNMKMGNKIYEIDYIVAVATGIKYRRMGLMREIIYKFLKDMYKDKKPFTFLLPANRAYYEPFDFCFVTEYENIVFNEKIKDLQVAKFVEKDKEELKEFINQTLDTSYDIFCLRDEKYIDRYLKELESEKGYIELYKKENKILAYKSFWGIKKTEQRDFISNKEYISKSKSSKEAYMCRIVNLEEFVTNISIEADSNLDEVEIYLNIEDKILDENRGAYIWHIDKKSSKLQKISKDFDENYEKYNISDLTAYLFGYKKIKEFEDKKIKVFKNIFINEIV